MLLDVIVDVAIAVRFFSAPCIARAAAACGLRVRSVLMSISLALCSRSALARGFVAFLGAWLSSVACMAGVLFVFMHTVYSHLDTRGGDSAGVSAG